MALLNNQSLKNRKLNEFTEWEYFGIL
jgi:hypothetical protein